MTRSRSSKSLIFVLTLTLTARLVSSSTCNVVAEPPTVGIGYFNVIDGSEFRYFVSSTDPRSWQDALNTCSAICAELLWLDSVQEYEFLNTALQIIPNRPTTVWTSGNDLTTAGVFSWANNRGPVLVFYPSTAATGQPDGDGHCITLQLRVAGTLWPMHIMNDRDCADKAAFICKSRLPPVEAYGHPHAGWQPQQPPSQPSSQRCKSKKFMMDSYFVDDGPGYRYFVSQLKTNWYGAMDNCEDLCAELTSFDSEAEYGFLVELARLRLGGAAFFWTAGLRLANATGSLGGSAFHREPFIWATTGRPVAQFYPTGSIEPNNVNGLEHCVGWEYGAMADLRCGSNLNYICRSKLN